MVSRWMFLHPSVFLFIYDNLSKYQWIFIKLCNTMCIDIVEIWFGIANGQILSIIYQVICPTHSCILFLGDNLSIYLAIFTKLGISIDTVDIWCPKN